MIFRLQRHARADEVVVVVPDPAADGDHVEPMLVGVERGPAKDHGGRRVGRGVLGADAEDRHLRLRIELANVAGERSERRAELGVVREGGQQQPGRRSLLRLLLLRVHRVGEEAAKAEQRDRRAAPGFASHRAPPVRSPRLGVGSRRQRHFGQRLVRLCPPCSMRTKDLHDFPGISAMDALKRKFKEGHHAEAIAECEALCRQDPTNHEAQEIMRNDACAGERTTAERSNCCS